MTTAARRATRVELHIPILYRLAGEDRWFQSEIHNLSESGVLFGPTDLQPGAPVEVILSPPIPIGSLAPGRQVCVAEVVRCTDIGEVAAEFKECRFLLES